MNFEEFERASVQELRKEAHAAFERAAFDRARQVDHVEELNKAQFYLQQIDRLENRHISRRDLILELVIIVLIGLELFYGIIGGNEQLAILDKLDASMSETARTLKTTGSEQVRALRDARQAILDTGEQQRTALNESRKALQSMVRLSKQQEEATRKQLAVAQQQWERENQRPQVMVMAVSLRGRLSPVWSVIPPLSELSAAYEGGKLPNAISFLIRNIGDARLRRPRVSANVEDPISLRCVSFSYYNPDSDKPCQVTNIDLPDLEPDPDPKAASQIFGKQSDLPFFVYVAVPPGATRLKIHLMVSGDNLGANLYSISLQMINP